VDHGVKQELRRTARVPQVRNPQRSQSSGTRHPNPSSTLTDLGPGGARRTTHSGTTWSLNQCRENTSHIIGDVCPPDAP
jgi:hypothetical protein